MDGTYDKVESFFLSTATGHKITARIIDDLLAFILVVWFFFSLLKRPFKRHKKNMRNI